MVNATPLLRLFAKYRISQLARQDPVAIQEQQLRSLVARGASTRFGAEHGFAGIRTVEDFQSAVPLRKYDDFWNTYWKDAFPVYESLTWPGRVNAFTWSSGTTTGKRKYLPYTKAFAKSYAKAGTDLLVHHVANRPHSQVLGGKSFMLSGCTAFSHEPPGGIIGEISSFSAVNLPIWARPFYFPPKDLSDISDWVVRAEKIAQAIDGQDIRTIGGMPSWLLIFFEKFTKRFGTTEGLITKLFPNLELFVHGGVKFDPYLKQYQHLLKGGHSEFREIYPASEGFFAVADRGYGEGMRLVLDHDIFYEFVPVEELGTPNPTRHWVKNIETGVNYAIILTTAAGVWSYVIGDTVRFVDTRPPRLLVTGRTSYSMSAFGEHLIHEEIEKGIAAAADRINNTVTDYSLGVRVFGQQGNLGYHVYVVEFGKPIDQQILKTFRDTLDETLRGLNDDYVDHRAPGCGLHDPVVIAVRPGTFARWMESRGKLGDQFKVPRIVTDRELFQHLTQFCASCGGVVAELPPPPEPHAP